MHVYMQNTGLGKRILEAAAKTKDPSLAQKIKDPKKDLLSSCLEYIRAGAYFSAFVAGIWSLMV